MPTSSKLEFRITKILQRQKLQHKVTNSLKLPFRIFFVLAIAGVILLGSGQTVHAATMFTNDYPDWDAAVYNLANFDWWKDEPPFNGTTQLPGELLSSRSYAYRNCTDGVAWWVSQYLPGYSVPSNWSSAIYWDNNAPSNQVDVGTTNDIEPGDIAQSDDGISGFGHVGFVTSVGKDANGNVTSLVIAEMNKLGDGNANTAGDGEYTSTTYSTRNGVNKFDRGGSKDWDNFIDLNGTGKGLYNENWPSSEYRPAVIQRSTGETDVAVVGANHQLDFYVNFQNQTGWGNYPITNSGAAAHSTPAMVQRPSGETDIAYQGPNNSLHFYWNLPSQTNWGGGAIPNAQAFSAPAMVQRPNGQTLIVVRGPNNRIDVWFNDQGQTTWNMVTVSVYQATAAAYGEPALALRSSGELDIAVQNASNSLDFYYNPTPGQNVWGKCGVAIPGYAMSPPAMVQRPTTGETDIAVQGPSNTLFFYWNLPGNCGWSNMQVTGGNTMFNDVNPPAMRQRPGGETDITVQGLNNSATMYFNFLNQSTWGSTAAAAAGTVIRPPVMVQRPSGETDLVTVGPSNRLDFLINQQNAPNSWSAFPIAGSYSAL